MTQALAHQTDARGRVDPEASQRLAREAAHSFQFLWRTLRRLGVRPDERVDDAVQRVFEIAAAKQASIAVGCERAFLFKTALLVAAEERRGARREGARSFPLDADPQRLADGHPNPEQLLEEQKRRKLLDGVLDAMSPDLRTVFVLFELEGMSTADIAKLLEVPPGTVASRLRRAREDFRHQAQRLRSRLGLTGGGS